MRTDALAVFHRPPERLNCAQAVVHAFQATTGSRTHLVEEFKAFGGGRAPGGECGALFAACQVAPAKAEQLRERFRGKAGGTLCRQLKRELNFPCVSCVALAAELLEGSVSYERAS